VYQHYLLGLWVLLTLVLPSFLPLLWDLLVQFHPSPSPLCRRLLRDLWVR